MARRDPKTAASTGADGRESLSGVGNQGRHGASPTTRPFVLPAEMGFILVRLGIRHATLHFEEHRLGALLARRERRVRMIIVQPACHAARFQGPA